MTVKLVKRRSTHDVHHLEPIVGIILAVSFVTIARPRRRAVVVCVCVSPDVLRGGV